MQCSECREKIDDRLDQMLSPAQVAAFEAHLAQCDACRNEFESLAAVDAGANRLGRIGDDLIDAFDKPAQQTHTFATAGADHTARLAKRSHAPLIRWGGLGLAAAVLITAGVQLASRFNMRHSNGTGPTTVQLVDSGNDVRPNIASGNVEHVRPAHVESLRTGDIIVPIESSDPSIRIVWVYQTADAGSSASQPKHQS